MSPINGDCYSSFSCYHCNHGHLKVLSINVCVYLMLIHISARHEKSCNVVTSLYSVFIKCIKQVKT